MPDIPDSVAAAQPIIYILAVTLVVVLVAFIGLVKWLMDKYVASLDKVVVNLVEQNNTQILLLEKIHAIVSSNANIAADVKDKVVQQPERRNRRI